MKKFTLLPLLIIAFYGCNNPLNKEIYEPLKPKEIKEAIDNDTLFRQTYKMIQKIKDSVLTTDLEKAKFAGLTYNRIFKLVKFSQDSAYFKPLKKKIKSEWQEKYGVLQEKVDSVSKHWKNLKKEKSLSNYVKIEIVGIDKEYYTYSHDIKNVNLAFKLTPLKGRIEQLRFGFIIKPKIEDDSIKNPYESLYSTIDESWCLTTTPFSKPTVRYWEANYSNEKILKYKTINTFKRDYNIHIDVDKIRKDGKNLSEDDLNIPESVKMYWEYGDGKVMKEFYAEDILKDLLNIKYVPEYLYLSKGVQEEYKNKDSLAFEFLTAESNIKE